MINPLLIQVSFYFINKVTLTNKLFNIDASGFVLPIPLTSTSIEEGKVLKSNERRTLFKQIITKCVLQLLLIDTVRELLFDQTIYSSIPPQELLRFVGLLDESYKFAKAFNNNQELRMGLWKVG